RATTVPTLQRLDPTAGAPAWTAADLAPMPTGLNGGAAVFLKGKIYIPGGVTPSVELSPLQFAYDPAANIWSMPARPLTPAFLYALATDEARGVYYLTGGIPSINGTAGATTIRSYDPGANTWTDLPP